MFWFWESEREEKTGITLPSRCIIEWIPPPCTSSCIPFRCVDNDTHIPRDLVHLLFNIFWWLKVFPSVSGSISSVGQIYLCFTHKSICSFLLFHERLAAPKVCTSVVFSEGLEEEEEGVWFSFLNTRPVSMKNHISMAREIYNPRTDGLSFLNCWPRFHFTRSTLLRTKRRENPKCVCVYSRVHPVAMHTDSLYLLLCSESFFIIIHILT